MRQMHGLRFPVGFPVEPVFSQHNKNPEPQERYFLRSTSDKQKQATRMSNIHCKPSSSVQKTSASTPLLGGCGCCCCCGYCVFVAVVAAVVVAVLVFIRGNALAAVATAVVLVAL